MTTIKHLTALIDASSLGTRSARAARTSVTAAEGDALARRAAEVAGKASAAEVTDQVLRRDRDDSTVSNFTDAAEGVTVIDSTFLSPDEVVDEIMSLAEAARRVDELGLQIHIHAIGDAAVRQALDAIDYVQRRNGPRDRRPVIAHVQLVDQDDIGRFAALGVIPNMQPLWAQMDALMTVLTIPRLGVERADRQYQLQTLHRTGAALAFGSDWPVSSGAPLDGIAVAVSRRTAEGEPEGGWTPHEIVPIELALSSYTGAVAYQAFAEGKWGRITPGASADLVWFDRDPRSTPPLELPGVEIRATYLRGAQAYRNDD